MYRYSGDYAYRKAVGDYYQGDPFLGGLIRAALPFGKKLLTGGISIGKKIFARRRAVIPAIATGAGAVALTRATLPRAARMPGMRGGGRRMNVTNVKALRRAGRRVRGFLKLASRLGALPVSRGKGKKLFQKKRR